MQFKKKFLGSMKTSLILVLRSLRATTTCLSEEITINKNQRWDKLLYHLRTKPSTQEDLADIFDVSTRTIRKWLEEIEKKHSDEVVLGKAKDPETGVFYYSVSSVLPKQKHEKRSYTFKVASDGTPYITVMIPDDVGDTHPDYGAYLKFLPLADIHYGHRSANNVMFQRAVDLLHQPHTYSLLGGDLTENSGRYSIGGGVYEQLIPPQQQQDEMIEILRPVAHKMFLASSGNHGYRSWKAVGLDPDMTIANAFDIPYFLGQYHLDINWRGQVFSVVGYHGKGKGSSVKASLDALVTTARINEVADFHIMFHLHRRMQHEFVVPKRDRANMKLVDHKSRAVLFGGFLNYWREYCDVNAMDKNFIGTYSLILCEDGTTKVREEDLLG